jgi:bacillithiol biosynthesis cysteine-adding enzyme BshC
MPKQLVKPAKEFHYSELYMDFVAEDSSLDKYLGTKTPAQAAAMMHQTGADRETVCDILVRQNEDFGAKPKTFEAIKKLRREDALCIFTGQQVGLFGGPLFSLFKAIGIIKKAVQLESELKRPVVPVFWMASDDHDYEEINHYHYIESDGSTGKLVYGAEIPQNIPASEIYFSDRDMYNELLKNTREHFGPSEFSEDFFKRLFAAYSHNSGFTDAFARFYADLLPDLGLVFFSPADADIKGLSKKFFRNIVEQYFNVKSILEQTATTIEMDKYHIQAEKKLTAVHLFYHNPGREAIHFADESFIVDNRPIGLPGVLDLIERSPEQFSPDVLTRPLWQSYLFPVVAHAGGPSEIAYFCQIGQLFRLFKMAQPYYFARPSATLVEKHHEELMVKHGLELNDLTGDVEQLINRIVAKTFPHDLDNDFGEFRDKLRKLYDELKERLIAFDGSLEPMTEQTYGKFDFALNNLEKKAFSAHKKGQKLTREQIYRLEANLMPYKNLQERSLGICYFAAKYGPAIVDFILDRLDVATKEHQMIYLSELTE